MEDYLLVLLPPILLILAIQGAWMFIDAGKRGENQWLWGIFGLLNTPGHLIIYLIVSRRFRKTAACQSCGKIISEKWKFCPHCGKAPSE